MYRATSRRDQMDRNPSNVTAATNISSTTDGRPMTFDFAPLRVDDVGVGPDAMLTVLIVLVVTDDVDTLLRPSAEEGSSDMAICESSTSEASK